MRVSDPQQRAYHRSVARYHDTRLEPALRALFGFIGDTDANRADAAVSVLTDCLSRLAHVVDPAPYLWAEQLCLTDCAYPTTLFMAQDVSAALGKPIELPTKLQVWQTALYEDQTIQQVVDDNRAAVAAWIASKQKSKITCNLKPQPVEKSPIISKSVRASYCQPAPLNNTAQLA